MPRVRGFGVIGVGVGGFRVICVLSGFSVALLGIEVVLGFYGVLWVWGVLVVWVSSGFWFFGFVGFLALWFVFPGFVLHLCFSGGLMLVWVLAVITGLLGLIVW